MSRTGSDEHATRFTIKICGIARLEDAALVAACGVDYAGLIRIASPRRISDETVTALVDVLKRGSTRPVLLHRDSPIEQVCEELRAFKIDHIQLHGLENVEYVRELKRRAGASQVIKAWHVDGPGAARKLGAFLDLCASNLLAIILDHPKTGASAREQDFVHAARAGRAHGVPVWLAGGLTPANVAQRLRKAVYDGADVARGVEASPGVKDAEAVRAFVAAVRGGARFGEPGERDEKEERDQRSNPGNARRGTRE